MKLSIDTPKGKYTYEFKIVYNGIKVMDRAIAKENLLLFNSVAKRYDLRFGLIYGTLLGAIREHDFIAHDEDIDLFILREDLDLFKSMLFELRDNGFEVIRYDRRDGLCSIMRKGEYIDFYVMSPLIEGVREYLGDPIPARYVEDLVEYDFQGEKFLAARDAEEAVMFNYGGNWRTPVVMNRYDMSWIDKMKSKLNWWFYYAMPDFIFNPLMEKRAVKKMERYNMRAARLNGLLGREVVKEIPTDCYKIRKKRR
ncbi:MAG: LicD family protein [Bacteroidaceae bacterium]|nr:LicD family protein [Bacteroidaceae bacterium]